MSPVSLYGLLVRRTGEVQDAHGQLLLRCERSRSSVEHSGARRTMTRQGHGSSGGDIDGGKRQRARDSLLLTAQIRLDSEPGLREVRVRNLSAGGLMIELDEVADVGTPVMITLRGVGEVGGKVAWCTEGRIGISLDSLIDPSKVRKA